MCEEMLVSPGEDPRSFLCGTPQHEMDRSPLGPSLQAPADKPNGCAHHKAGNQTCTEDPPKNELNEGASWRISLNGTRCEDAAPDLLGLCPSAGVRVCPIPICDNLAGIPAKHGKASPPHRYLEKAAETLKKVLSDSSDLRRQMATSKLHPRPHWEIERERAKK
jgi:hypothetical protein